MTAPNPQRISGLPGGTPTPESMPVLTLWQPWASLAALGVKTIETRSWSTKYRGPLAIAAAATTKGFDALPGDCEGTIEGGWRYGYIGDFQAGYCFRSSDEGRRGDTFLVRDSPPPQTDALEITPPLGAIVATCTLLDVLPIVDPLDCGWDLWGTPCAHAAIDGQVIWHREGYVHTTVLVEEAYGDYTPGRFAWVLKDIEQLDEPVPFKGGQGLTRRWTPDGD